MVLSPVAAILTWSFILFSVPSPGLAMILVSLLSFCDLASSWSPYLYTTTSIGFIMKQ